MDSKEGEIKLDGSSIYENVSLLKKSAFNNLDEWIGIHYAD